MKKIHLVMGLFLSLIFTCVVDHAQAESGAQVIDFNGQQEESLDLSLDFIKTVIRKETYEDTCTRQVVVGHETQCRNVTRHRQSCQDVPRQSCQNVPQTLCRNVTRHRQQCSAGPSRRVCTTQPSRQVCSTNPRSGQQVCRTVGGGQSCTNVPGPQTCRSVPYTDRQCSTTYQRQCRTVVRTECRSIPYDDRVCEQIPQYENQQYTCQKVRDVPEDVQTQSVGEVDVKFESELAEPIRFEVKLLEDRRIGLRVLENPSDAVVIVKDKQEKDVERREDFAHMKASYVIQILDKEEIHRIENAKVSDVRLIRSTESIEFHVDQDISKTQIHLEINRKRKDEARTFILDPNKESVKIEQVADGYKVQVKLEKKDFSSLRWLSRYDVSLTVTQDSSEYLTGLISGNLDHEEFQFSHEQSKLRTNRR